MANTHTVELTHEEIELLISLVEADLEWRIDSQAHMISEEQAVAMAATHNSLLDKLDTAPLF